MSATKLWLVRLAMLAASGKYEATRVVVAQDSDQACNIGLERERARQEGVEQAGGVGHIVSHVAGLRRLPSKEVR